jgi:hypothetical protein
MAMAFQCDALAPLQVKREDGRPMFTLPGYARQPGSMRKTHHELPDVVGSASPCRRWTRPTSAAR